MKAIKFEKSLLVISKILRLFVNTFTAYDKYAVLNRDMDMELSQKQKTFCELFSPSLKLKSNFQHIKKRHGTHS